MSHVKCLADKTLSQTAPPGQQQIRRELETLNFDWQKYCSELRDAETGLQGALEGWNEYDSLYDSLSQWLSEMESQVKDYELKSSLSDKQAQVGKYKVRRGWVQGTLNGGWGRLGHNFSVSNMKE